MSSSISGHAPGRVKFGAILADMQACLRQRLCTTFLAALVCACSPSHSNPAAVRPVSVSVWSYLDLANAPDERAAFFQFAARYHVREVYLEASGLVSRAPTPLADFIQAAQDRGIQVSLVLGRPAWLEPERLEEALTQVRAVRDFADSLRGAGQVPPRTLQLDVEPHVLAAWEREWPRLGSQYLDLLEAVKRELGTGLSLAVAIPVWWDQRMIARQGRRLPLSRWAIELADLTVLMDYRNQTAAILSSAEVELADAEVAGRKVVLGLAVHCSSDRDNMSTSFCLKGHGVLTQAMREVEAQLRDRPSYGGLAVFTYEDWRLLKP